MAPRPPKFNFYLDENFPVMAGKFFAMRGHVVLDGRRVLSPGKSDHRHLAEAARRNAILVSLDKDFRVHADLRAKIADSPGVLLYRVSAANLTEIRTITARILRDATPSTFRGKILRASIDQIRSVVP